MTDAKYFAPDFSHHAIERYREGRDYTPPRREIIDGALTIAAKYAKDYDIVFLAWAIMPNHNHLLPVDRVPRAASRVGDFMQQFKAKLTTYLQVFWNIDDKVFTEMVMSELFPVLDIERVFETIAYVETNPLKDGLVRRVSELPAGTVSTRQMRREPIVVKRPKRWFREKTWPDEVTIKPEVPEWLLEKYRMSLPKFDYRADVEVFATTYAISMERRNKKAIGYPRLKKKSPYEAGKEIEKDKKVMCAGSRRSCAQYYVRVRKFKRAYKKAQKEVRDGRHDVKFPYGTHVMANRHGFEVYVSPG